MRLSWQTWLEQCLLVGLAMLLYLALFELNAWALTSLEHAPGVNWIFLPAGLRVFLVLILGAPGALGLVLGTWAIDLLRGAPWTTGLFLNGLVSGLMPWLLRLGLERLRLFPHDLRDLHWPALSRYVLLYALLNALAHQTAWQLTGWRASLVWVDIWPMVVGDLAGALIVIGLWRLLLQRRTAML